MPESARFTYFAPGEVVVVVEHAFSEDNREEQILSFLRDSPILNGTYGYGTLYEELAKPGEELSASLSSQPDTLYINPEIIEKLQARGGLLPALERLEPGAIRTFSYFREGRHGSYAFLSSRDGELLMEDDQALAYLTGELSYQSRTRQEVGADDPRIVAVIPNWYFGGSFPASLTDGGPGARPVPPHEIQQGHSVEPDALHFTAREMSKALRVLTPAAVSLGEKLGTPGTLSTKVFILDTIPGYYRLAQAYNNWGLNGNTLLARLLENPQRVRVTPSYYQTERLKLVYYDQTGDPDFQARTTRGHDYDMADHGLFIAGIIDTLAPNADLYLLQVLNDHGVGTFRSLIWGLEQIIQFANEAETGSFLINCSLIMSLPFDSSQVDPAQAEMPWYWLIWFYQFIANLVDMTEDVKNLFDFIAGESCNAIVLAAAGNDNRAPDTQAEARYPARFESVIGVGALNKDGEIAHYSNKADHPEISGFLAFGGDANFQEASSADGILGVFTAPNYAGNEKNTSGWARWAGSSFACAVACGALAHLYNHGLNAATARTLLEDASEEDQAGAAHYIPVGQGPA